MKTRTTRAVVLSIGILYGATACELAPWSELCGTWNMPYNGGYWLLVINMRGLAWEMSGAPAGRVEFSFEDVDERADRILATLVSASGDLADGAPIGELFYMTYTIDSTTAGVCMYYSATQTGYDPSMEMGPFTRE